jgi:hypothetical protein
LFSLAQAGETLQQANVAIGAYTRLLKLNIDPTQKAQIRQRIKTLRRASPAGG